MLTINQILKTNPVFILSVNYDAGSLADMLGEPDRDDIHCCHYSGCSHNEYLAEMTIQYKWRNDLTLIDQACLAFTVECLVSVNDDKVTIEEMNTSSDYQAVYANNIKSLPNGSYYVWGHDTNEGLHEALLELIESQPIYDIPEHFTIESY